MRMKYLKWFALLLALWLLVIFPLVLGDPVITPLAITTLLFCAASIAWNIFSGYTGYISLGHATFFGLGAYTLAIACKDWHIPGGYLLFLLVPVAGLVAAVSAIPLGWIALGTRRHTFMVISLAIFFFFQTQSENLANLTGGAGAVVYLPFPSWDASFFDVPFYFVALTIFLLAFLVSWWVRASRFGLGLLAIRDDEDRALGLGVKTGRYKLVAYALSAFFIGMVGAVVVCYDGSITPAGSFSSTFDVTIALMVILGGRGTIVGPLVGGMLLIPLQQYLNLQYGSTPLEPMLYGSIMLIVILLLPEGIMPSLSQRWPSWLTFLRRQESKQELSSPQLQAVPEIFPDLIASFVSQPAGSADFHEIRGQSTSLIEQQSQSVTMPSSLANIHWSEYWPATIGAIQRVKSQRLVAIPHPERLMIPQERIVDSSLNKQTRKADLPVVSWRCPRCHKPFLLKGNDCYCPRCGIIRSLAEIK